ncbi:MAG TPA: DUF397 domain-containing protein [Propionibacteriaceae bacterium]|jgi:hypothetical protein|nr:DUF397 domain-containing protein [Propionibacteriaceae bacterium]
MSTYRQVGASELARASWRKSSRSGSSANCVETCRLTDGLVAVRDSKNQAGTVLILAPGAWETFTRGVRDGQFD